MARSSGSRGPRWGRGDRRITRAARRWMVESPTCSSLMCAHPLQAAAAAAAEDHPSLHGWMGAHLPTPPAPAAAPRASSVKTLPGTRPCKGAGREGERPQRQGRLEPAARRRGWGSGGHGGVAGRWCREGQVGAARREAASGGGAVAWCGGGAATAIMEGNG